MTDRPDQRVDLPYEPIEPPRLGGRARAALRTLGVLTLAGSVVVPLLRGARGASDTSGSGRVPGAVAGDPAPVGTPVAPPVRASEPSSSTTPQPGPPCAASESARLEPAGAPSAEDHRLAAALVRNWRTHDAPRLVQTIREAAAANGADVDVPLLIAVAAAESAGRTTAVSPTGAAGLFQLMPVEVLRSGGSPLALSADDALGFLWYVTKKPAGDVTRITRALLAAPAEDTQALDRARTHLAVAQALRCAEFEDLTLFAACAPPDFLDRAAALDFESILLLSSLEDLLSAGAPREQLHALHRRAAAAYDAAFAEQEAHWDRAHDALVAARDAHLEAAFNEPARVVLRRDQYAAAHALAALDVRFSPHDAFPLFLQTLARKREEAHAILGAEALDVARERAAVVRLYNGGVPTVRRTMAGIQQVRESDRHEQRVLACYARLKREEQRIAAIGG